MKEPWARIVSLEPNNDSVVASPGINNIALDGVLIVSGVASCTSDHAEGMTVEMEGMLNQEFSQLQSEQDENLDPLVLQPPNLES